MKHILKLFIISLAFTLHLFGDHNPHLLLYFDVNKTLIASDDAGHKSVENVLNELLAEKYTSCWEPSIQKPISFDTYVNEILIPGPKDDQTLKAQRKTYLQHFLDYLNEHNNPLYPAALKDFEEASKVLAASSGKVFASFYSLCDYLNQTGISFSIILRSFGNEVFDIKNEISATGKITFTQTGEFHNSTLVLENGSLIEDPHAIYDLLKQPENIAIHDDWNYWHEHHGSAQYGKPFLIEQEDLETLSIFFDDNINENDTINNIITPLNVTTSELIPIPDLVATGQAVHVNTLKAILDVNYYIHCVENALHKHQSKDSETSSTSRSIENNDAWSFDFRNSTQNGNASIDYASSKVKITAFYDYVMKKPIKNLTFNYLDAPTLRINFNLSEVKSGDATLIMRGCAAADDTKRCYFYMRVNGQLVAEFIAVDDFDTHGNYINTTKLSIPSDFLKTGENTLELEIFRGMFPAYDAQFISFEP